jgi:glycerol-3-phosphate acyltransferase PlsY
MVLPYVAGFCGGAADPSVPRLACAVCSIAGHNWPVFLKFRGGKGVATSAGALLGVAWMPLVAGLIVWLIVFAASRYVSVASLSAAAAVTACAWLTLREGNMAIPVALTALGALIVLRHRSNIGRLLKGTEHRAEFRGRARPREQG